MLGPDIKSEVLPEASEVTVTNIEEAYYRDDDDRVIAPEMWNLDIESVERRETQISPI